MRADFAADAIFQRRDDLATRGVIFRIGREHQQNIQRQTHGVTLNLDVALLHDVEQSNLNFAGQIGQFIDGEDPAIGARKQAVMHGQLVRKILAAAGCLDGIDIADHVGNGDVGRGQLFDVALVATEPRDGRFVSLGGNQIAAALANRVVRIIANLAAGYVRQALVEQGGEHPNDARLGLPAQPQQNEIVAGQNRVDNLRDHRVVVTHDAWKKLLAALEFTDEILAQLFFHAAFGHSLFGKGAGFQRAKSDR
jgi:hypothetical protein